jgi:glutathione S-transferase
MHEFVWPGLVTLGVLLMLFALTGYVGNCRVKYNVPPPAMSGDPAFMRAYRVHMNTVEGAVLFLPALWLFAAFVSGAWAAVLGAAWLAARLWYALVYLNDPARRLVPYFTALSAFGVLYFGAAWGMLKEFL